MRGLPIVVDAPANVAPDSVGCGEGWHVGVRLPPCRGAWHARPSGLPQAPVLVGVRLEHRNGPRSGPAGVVHDGGHPTAAALDQAVCSRGAADER
eukprot:11207956-Lingulodinium_polyedra.AAC.1